MLLVLHLEQLDYTKSDISEVEKEIWAKTELRIRLKTEDDETLETVKGQIFGEQLLADVACLSATGPVHFELSLNNVNFDNEYSNWKEELLLTKSGAINKEAAKLRVQDLKKKMSMASVVFWENPLLVDLEPDFLYFNTECTVSISCTGYPLFDTGEVVVNLSELDLRSGAALNNHTVPAAVDRTKQVISFNVPNIELVDNVDLEVRASLDGGRNFSPPCFKRIQVRGRPVLKGFSPLLASCEGGSNFTIRGENLHARQGNSAWIRFQGRGYDRRIQVLPSGTRKDELSSQTPRLMELESYGNCRLKVKVSLDDGRSWMECGEEFTSHPPLMPQRLRPRVVSAHGGTTVRIEGENLFSSSSLMGRIVRMKEGDEGSLPGEETQSADFRLKFYSVQKCFCGVVPALSFVGPAFLLVTVNGQDWASVPEVVTVTDKEIPSEEGKVVQRYEEMEKRRVVRIQERAKSLLQMSAPPQIARAEGVKRDRPAMGGVGISVGRNAGGRMVVKKISRNSPAEGKLRVGDVIVQVRDVERRKEEEGEETKKAQEQVQDNSMLFSSKNLKTADVETLLRGPLGSWVIVTLSSGRTWRLQRKEEEGSSRCVSELSDPARKSKSRKEGTGAGREEGRTEEASKDREARREAKEEVISRSSLVRYRRHFDRFPVKDACLHRLRELHLPSSPSVTQWEVVASLLTSRRVVTGADLDRYGIPRPSLLPYWSRSGRRRKEAGSVEGKQEEEGRKEKRKAVKAELSCGVRYEGEVKGSRAEGQGKMWFPDGTCYEGEFVDGQCHGEGRWEYKTGEVYVGSFRNGMAEGEGRLTGRGGEEEFEGKFVQNLPHGWGRKRWGDGSSYEGEWKRGVQHGEGKWRKGGNEYEGRFEDGMPEGEGRMVYSTGEVYQGEWSKGIQHGRGVLFERKERVYDGLWRNGRRTGKGIDRRRVNNVGVYREEEEEDGVEDLYDNVVERIEIRSMAEDVIGFVRAVGEEEEKLVHRFVISGVDVNAAVSSSYLSDKPWLSEVYCEEEDKGQEGQEGQELEQEQEKREEQKRRFTAMGVLCCLVRYKKRSEQLVKDMTREVAEEEMYCEEGVEEERLGRMRDTLIAGGGDVLACLRRAVRYAEEEVVAFLLEGRYEDEWISDLVDDCSSAVQGDTERGGMSDRIVRVRARLASCLRIFPQESVSEEVEGREEQQQEEEEQQLEEEQQQLEEEGDVKGLQEDLDRINLLSIHEAMITQCSAVVMPEGSGRLPDMVREMLLFMPEFLFVSFCLLPPSLYRLF
eukprot:749747-Hanusia_phi.AAC.2